MAESARPNEDTILALLGDLLPKSAYRLGLAAQMRSMDGLGCTLVLEVPEKASAPIELSIYSGRHRLGT